MLASKWLLLLALCIGGLNKALAGKASSSKRKASESDSEEWAHFALHLHSSNQLPGTEAKRNIEKATSAGAKGLKLRGKKGKKNAARTLKRAWPKTTWPSLYWAKIPIKDKKSNARILVDYPFQLPHEWLGQYMVDTRALERSQPAQGSKVHRALLKQTLRLSAEDPLGSWMSDLHMPLGFHGDGVPVQGTMRQESLDFLTINMPTNKHHKDFRVPFTVIQAAFHFNYETKRAILDVLLWSLGCSKKGKYPTCRHDGSPWGPQDKKRSCLQGRLPAKGMLCEIRGDRDWLNSWLNFPTWNTGSGMCWLCEAKHINYKSWGPNDRKAGLDKAKFVERVQNLGKELCPLWEWPELIPSELCLPDWLHAVDQGIGADIAGQIHVELADQQPARAFKGRVALLWEEIKGLYKEFDVEYRLASLTPGVLNKDQKNNKNCNSQGVSCPNQTFYSFAAYPHSQIFFIWE